MFSGPVCVHTRRLHMLRTQGHQDVRYDITHARPQPTAPYVTKWAECPILKQSSFPAATGRSNSREMVRDEL